MEKVLLGKTGLEVSRLGIGLSEIGSSDEETSKKILNTWKKNCLKNKNVIINEKKIPKKRDKIILLLTNLF